jgi:UPF0716 protein FxsA
MGRRVGLAAAGVLAVGVLEIVLFVLVAHWIGIGLTLLLVLATSLLGGWLLRREGIRAWRALRTAGLDGRPPGAEASQGLFGLLGGMLLVVPGFLSDVAGLALLTPPVRKLAGVGLQRAAVRRLSPAAAGDLFGPRRVRVRRGEPYQPTPSAPSDDAPIEGEIVG